MSLKGLMQLVFVAISTYGVEADAGLLSHNNKVFSGLDTGFPAIPVMLERGSGLSPVHLKPSVPSLTTQKQGEILPTPAYLVLPGKNVSTVDWLPLQEDDELLLIHNPEMTDSSLQGVIRRTTGVIYTGEPTTATTIPVNPQPSITAHRTKDNFQPVASSLYGESTILPSPSVSYEDNNAPKWLKLSSGSQTTALKEQVSERAQERSAVVSNGISSSVTDSIRASATTVQSTPTVVEQNSNSGAIPQHDWQITTKSFQLSVIELDREASRFDREKAQFNSCNHWQVGGKPDDYQKVIAESYVDK